MIEIEDVRRKKIENKAEEYLNRIFYGVEVYRRMFPHKELTVFMSSDVYYTLCNARDRRQPILNADRTITVCGCNIEFLYDDVDKLYVGYKV